ncbi:MAG TPA: DinB family protein [Luteitalea sp.]|nr:DinB family protein [Luteitalea sp.]
MKLWIVLLTAISLVAPSGASAQIPAGMKVGITQYLQGAYGGLKSTVLNAAERMPEADYGFRPSSETHVRTFAQVVAHIAASQFSTCASLRGTANPIAGRDLEKELTTRPAALRMLSESFALCDEAIESLSDANGGEYVNVGRGQAARAAVIAGLLAHTSEMYGISTVYLRAKGLVPPASPR